MSYRQVDGVSRFLETLRLDELDYDLPAELIAQTKAYARGESLEVAAFKHQIAFNVIPHIDAFLENGYTKEEWKVVTESRKILHLPDLPVSCTAVRVPVFVGHSEAVHVETRDPITPAQARALMAAVPGVVIEDDPATNLYPLAERAAGSDEVYVGRIRQDASLPGNRGLAFWCVSDNLRKGAATNAVQIAQVLLRDGLLKKTTRG